MLRMSFSGSVGTLAAISGASRLPRAKRQTLFPAGISSRAFRTKNVVPAEQRLQGPSI
jgi:hypothetical protein